MNTKPPFIHLRVHSAYSLCEGAIKIADIPDSCISKGMPAIAITDSNNMFGVLEVAMKCSSKGIQPIPGCLLNLKFEDIIAPIVLIAQNEFGYKNLLKLMTCFYVENTEEEKFITLNNLVKYHEGVIALSGGATGPAGEMILQGNNEKAMEFMNGMHSIFGNNFYIEISRHGIDIEKRTEPFFIEFALQNNVPLVATNEAFFIAKEMYQAHDILTCISEGTYVTVKDRKKYNSEYYLKSSEEMYDLFRDIPEAILNTSLIAKRCSFMPEPKKPMLPRFDDGSGENEDDIIEKQSKEGLLKRLSEEVFYYKENENKDKKDIEKEYFDRLSYELSVIKNMGFSGYFLIVSDFVKWTKSQDIPVGPGRGSGAGSVVGWSLYITDLDPIKYTLIFERFLNPERISMPDFDIDFCQDRRDEVINYVQSKYGKNKVAHIIALGKLQARAVLRDVGRVIQMPYGQVDKISKLIPQNQVNPVDLKQALEIEPALKQMMEEDDSVKFLIETGLKLEGLYRHASMHAAGIVISNKPVDELVPLHSDGESKLAITQFNMKFAETAGLVKFDFLGLKTLTLIKNTCNNVKKYKDIDLKISKIDLEDQKTFDLLCSVDVVGVFQLESAGMKDVIQKLQPDRLEDLIALVSLYRPGPLDDIPKYLARKHGKETIVYLHPMLEPILKATYGVMVYQEQVLKIAQEMGGYTLASADLLRRAMGKKNKEEMEKQRKIFTDGAISKGVNASVATQVFALMEKFAGYGFNRSHAAPYALLSYQTAYLKANFRREFYISIMNLDMDNTDKISTFVQDAKSHKVDVFQPDINKSEEMFIGENKGVRYALGALKGSSVAAMQDIVAERSKNGLFKDIFDFFKRTKHLGLNKRQLETLIFSGAFDSIHKNRHQILASLEKLTSDTPCSSSRQRSLFAEYKSEIIELSNVTEWNEIEKLDKERSAIGFYLSAHPMDVYSEFLGWFNVTRSSQFSSERENITVAGILLAKKEKLSKNAQKYAFLTISDQDNTFEITVFPDLYSRISGNLKIGNALIIDVNIKIDSGNAKLLANSIQNINSIINNQKIYLKLAEHTNVDLLYNTIESFEDGNNSISFIIERVIGKKIEIETKYKKNISIENRKKLTSIDGVEFFLRS